MRPFAPWQPSLPWSPFRSCPAPPPPTIVSLPGPPSMTLACLVPIEDVVEGRALERLEAEEAVVAVAARFVLGERDLDAAAPAGADVGREGGDVAAAGAAVHAVVAVVAVDEVEVAGAAADRVDAEAARRLVAGAGAADDVVVAEVADHHVVVARRRRRRCRCRGRRGSGRAPRPPQMMSLPRLPMISSSPPPPTDHVAARRAAQLLALVGADDRDPRAVAAQDLVFPFGAVGAQRAAREEQRDEHRRHRGRLPHGMSVRHPNGVNLAGKPGDRSGAADQLLVDELVGAVAPSSRPNPERLKPPNGSSGLSARTRLT